MLAIAVTVLVIAHNLCIIEAAATQDDGNFIPIAYPEYLIHENDIHDSCKNLTYCTIKPDYYPEEIIATIIKDLKLSSNENNIINNNMPIEKLTIQKRFAEDEYEPACNSEVKVVLPHVVRSKSGMWRIVVQEPMEKYVQRTRIEICKNSGISCFEYVTSVNHFIDTICKETFATQEFVVLTKDNKTEKVPIILPAGCSCYYKLHY